MSILSEDDYFDYSPEEEDRKKYNRDEYWIGAQKSLCSLFNKDTKEVFYMKQLQVKFEKEYFHWVTRNAVVGLLKSGYLQQINLSISASGNTLHLHFFAHRSNRYPKRPANSVAKVVQEYSQDHIMTSCGNRAEILFAEALAGRGFTIDGKKVIEYNGKKWTKTKNDLDYIFKKDNIAYGCEIKNKLEYIDKKELEIKLKMCEYFNIRPFFIMRFSPKTYNKLIADAGGYALLFVAQIYDLSQKALVEKIRDVLGYEVDCPRAIPSGIIDRFEKWHNLHK